MNIQELKRSAMQPARELSLLLAALILIAVVFPAFQGWQRAQAQATLDLSVQKTHVGDFIIGGSGIYSIVVTNVGTQTVNGEVTISDSLPAGLTPIQAAGVDWNTCTISGQLVTCVYPNAAGIAPSAALPAVVVAVNVAQSAAPRVTNTATMSNANDANLVNNTSSDLTTIVSADLAVFKTVEPALPLEGEIITYTVSVLSNGPSAATGVVLTDTLPSGLTFGAASVTQGAYTPANGAWSIGGLAFGQAVTLTMTATVNSGMHGLEIINATNGLLSDLYDYNSANNSASASLRVQSTRLVGVVTPIGSTTGIPETTVTITDSLNHVYTATTGSTGAYSFTDTAATPLAAGAISARAEKGGYQASAKTTTLVAGVDTTLDFQLGTSDLVVKKTDGRSTILPGQTFTYTLAVTNTGTIAASGVLITDVLPAQLSYITDTLGLDHETPSTGVLVWELEDDLAAGESVTFKLRVKVADGLPTATYAVKNTLKAASDTPEVDLTDNTSEDTNTGSGSPNVSITLSVTPTSVRTAQNATYTIKVTNSGTAPVTEATVTDTFSTFVDIVSATTSKGSTSVNTSQRKVTATIGTLGSNSTATVTVVVKVNSSAKSNQTVSNTASVSYKFGGAVSTKNSTTVNFALVVASSLPGTGGIEPSARPPGSRAHLPALISAVLLAVLGVAALSYALWARSRRPEWAIWAGRMGGLFLGVAVSFGVIGWALMRFALPQQAAMVTPPPAAPAETAAPPVHHDDPAWVGLAPSGGLEKLPDYPVPTPTYQATPGEPGPDVSAVARLELPTIGVDTIVKYVPFDGLTWMIAGLQHEVAWMGETSWPGLGGNTALAGHVSLRTGDDGPFRHLDKLQTGDAVVVYTEENQYIYRVRERIIAEDTNLSVLAQTTASQLTLITCTNWDGIVGFYRDRLVVYADLKEVIPLDAQALAR